MKISYAARVLPALFAAPAAAQTVAPPANDSMLGVWLFVALFFGSIAAVGWMMWRGEKEDLGKALQDADDQPGMPRD